MNELNESLPHGWSVRIIQMNSIDWEKVQSRSRVFLEGTNESLRLFAAQRRCLEQHWDMPKLNILDILDHHKQDSDFENLSVKQQINVLAYVEQLAESAKEMGLNNYVGIIDCTRDPDRDVDNKPSIGFARTLRTNCTHLWVLPSPDLQATHS